MPPPPAQEYEQLVNETVSEYGLMEFLRLDLGASIRRDAALAPRNVMRIIAGNPLIMRAKWLPASPTRDRTRPSPFSSMSVRMACTSPMI